MKEKQKQLLSEMMQEDEIIEQFAIKYSNMHQDVSSTLGKYLVKAVFKDGAIWQQKQMYSEEEARKIWYAGQDYWRTNGESITFEELTSNLIRNKNQKSYSAQQVLELMKQAFEAGFKKADTVEAGLEPKETEQEINWILLKQNNK